MLILLFKIFRFNYVYLGVYGVFILFMAIKNITSEHIVLSDTGIEYHRFGATYNVNWENLEEINTRWIILPLLMMPPKQEGICIDPSLIRITEWWLGYDTCYSYERWNKEMFIPLSIFSENWRESELGRQIKQYAPHLFQ